MIFVQHFVGFVPPLVTTAALAALMEAGGLLTADGVPHVPGANPGRKGGAWHDDAVISAMRSPLAVREQCKEEVAEHGCAMNGLHLKVRLDIETV